MPRLSFYPVGDSYLLVLAVALVLLGLLVWGPSWQGSSRRRRLALGGVRLVVILLVILAMFRPTLVYTETTRQSATLIVLVDRSRSMSVPDALGGRKTRWEALRRSLADAEDGLERLADDFELKAYTFDAQARPAQLVGGKISLPDTPDGPQTAIGSVLNDVIGQESGKRLLGVILLSDGAQRAYAPRDLAPQTTAARMKHLGCPLYTVPFGQARGLGQAKDVAVKQLLVDPNVFVKNQLAIGGQVRIDGYVNREIPVKLLFETSPGKMEIVAQKILKPTADGQLMPVELSYAPQLPGEYKLTLEVDEQPGELVTTNNRLSTFVNVLRGGLNVLYLEGYPPRVDTRFLRRALDASADINVEFVNLDPRKPELRPGDMAERFKPGKYEVYVLGDLDSTAFRAAELRDMAEAVAKGAGLIMLGGFHSFGPGGYSQTPLADVMPIVMSRLERQPLDEPIRKDLHLPGPLKIELSRFGANHFAMRLAADAEKNRQLWGRLPPLDGANKFFKLKPTGLVLAGDSRGNPLLVAHPYGAGRVMAFAGDSTWRWWMRGFQSAHKRFWRQVVLWLAKKDESAEGTVWVKIPRRRLSPGQRLELTAGAQSPSGDPVTDATFNAEVVFPTGKKSPLRLVRKDDHWSGSFRDTRTAGDYAVQVTATRDGQLLGTARARFLVFEQDLELDNASADVTALESLAAMTGGESIAPEQLADLLRRMAEKTEQLKQRTETKRTFWDTWPFFLLLIGLLGVEWYLRKRWGLV